MKKFRLAAPRGTPPARYNPKWPVCGFCGVRHPAGNPHLPTEDHVLVNPETGQLLFMGFREQCEERARYVYGEVRPRSG